MGCVAVFAKPTHHPNAAPASAAPQHILCGRARKSRPPGPLCEQFTDRAAECAGLIHAAGPSSASCLCGGLFIEIQNKKSRNMQMIVDIGEVHMTN